MIGKDSAGDPTNREKDLDSTIFLILEDILALDPKVEINNAYKCDHNMISSLLSNLHKKG